jgi:hypothetical protein
MVGTPIQGLGFGDTIDDWVNNYKGAAVAIFRQSAQDVYSRVIRNLSGELVNVRTGFLRASGRASLSGMPQIDPKAYPKAGTGQRVLRAMQTTSNSTVVLVIKSAKLGDTIYLGWTAAYAAYVELGTSRMASRGYVRLAAQQWNSIVQNNVNRFRTMKAN